MVKHKVLSMILKMGIEVNLIFIISSSGLLHKRHAEAVERLFGYSLNHIEEIKEFLIRQQRETRDLYEDMMKEHELYPNALEKIYQVINKYEHKNA